MNVRNAGKPMGTACCAISPQSAGLSDSALVPPGRRNLPDRNWIIAADSETHCSAFKGDLLGFGLSCCSFAAGATIRVLQPYDSHARPQRGRSRLSPSSFILRLRTFFGGRYFLRWTTLQRCLHIRPSSCCSPGSAGLCVCACVFVRAFAN